MSHLEERQQQDLTTIRQFIDQQAEIVADAIKESIDVVLSGHKQQAYRVVLADHLVNRRMREIERLSHAFIATHLPSAGILRLLSGVMRANIELERIGDYAVTIARESVQMSHPPKGRLAAELGRICAEVDTTLRQATGAFSKLNGELARGTIALCSQVEGEMDLIYELLMKKSAKENIKKQQIKDALAMFVVFSQLKRVSDLAKNMCEHTMFAVSGEEKPCKIHNILFVDADNSRLAPMAEALARHKYAHSGNFQSAGFDPVTTLEPEVAEFLDSHGMDSSTLTSGDLDEVSAQDLREQQVVVCLEAGLEQCLQNVPFHTSIVEWHIRSEDSLEDIYRALSTRINDLMELLHCDDPD